MSKTVNGSTRTYLRDGVGVTAPVLSDGTRSSVPGISERVNGASYISHSDYLGTVTKQTDLYQSQTHLARFDAFGVATDVINPNGTQKGFAAQWGYQEDENGLKQLGHRLYDPELGRFLQRDPAKDGRNWYVYCENNPVNAVDPSGLTKIIVYSYAVKFMGMTVGFHIGIMLIDNTHGPDRVVKVYASGPSGDPTVADMLLNHFLGRLISKAGDFSGDSPELDGLGKHLEKAEMKITVLDDDSDYHQWRNKLDEGDALLHSGNMYYEAWPVGAREGNSNSYAYALLLYAGLLDAFEHGLEKRKKGRPWPVPGWGKNPWDLKPPTRIGRF